MHPPVPATCGAIVFFTIFSEMFLMELGVPGLGTSYDVAQGFAVFFRMSLGAVASGMLFGWGTRLLLYLLKRRLSREECVVEVATTFVMAYLSYFVTDQVFHCSGVIGTLTYGVLINHSAYINDRKLMEDFWALVEHLLNTVLFTLGGMMWGEIIANGNPEKQFNAADWGYLFVLYFFLILIRFVLLFSFYPITKSIGLGTNVQETLFSSFAGLRGAVGIALAIYIDNIVDIASYEIETNRLFGYVGGVAFLTLAINATLAGPLLRRLGLADRPVIREKVINVMHWRVRQRVIDDMVTLFTTFPSCRTCP
jgi:NhaP-type Na+/H+ or K+/H+ antiporter